MSRETTLKRILDGGIVAVVRSESSASLVKVVQALAEGGVTAAEITFTVPDALEVIRQVRRVVGDAIATGDFTRMRELACQYAAIVARVRETR
jgi:2-dehydro-3-deoxyphosphogluconate aldolase / (4S)-4-hydroxy-2-oxoglutarate aldolase